MQPRTERIHSTRMSVTSEEIVKKRGYVRKHSGELDFDLSIAFHEREQRASLSDRGSIARDTSKDDTATGGKFGKRVVFQIERRSLVSATSKKSETAAAVALDNFFKRIDEEAVRYALEHKGQAGGPLDSIVTPEESGLTEGRVSDVTLVTEDKEEVALSPRCEDSVTFEGGLFVVGPAKLDLRIVPKRVPKSLVTSQNVSVGGAGSYLIEELWPWPWLNPESRAKRIYRSQFNASVTFANEKFLPHLPLPVLAHTLLRYLESVKPCLYAGRYATTEKIVKEFACGEGKEYHEYLVESIDPEKHVNWVETFLPNYSYCYTRQEAVLMNRGIVAPFMYDLWPASSDSQLDRAAILVELAVEFWELLREERLIPIHDDKGHTICMNQFRNLFSSVKIPGIPCDALISYFKTEKEGEDTPRNVIVIYKGYIFSMDVVDSDFTLLSLDNIRLQLMEMVTSVEEGNAEGGQAVELLTSMERNRWSEARVHLMNISSENRACLHEIERAMFVLSLDHMSATDTDKLVHEALFADGCNRWYDKGLSFYIHCNGMVTVNVNTSIIGSAFVAILLHYMHLRIMEDTEKWDDDVVMAVSRGSRGPSRVPSGVDELLTKVCRRASDLSTVGFVRDKIASLRFQQTEQNVPTAHPILLVFETDTQLEMEIREAELSFADLASALRTAVGKYDEYEADLFNRKGINTDAFAHLVMHLTFFRMYFRAASIGSKVSLLRFYNGRYEFMRTTTSEAIDWCKIMMDPTSKQEAKRDLFWKAERKHMKLLKECCSGKGFENHLAALSVIAEDKFDRTPKLFEEKAINLSGGAERFDIVAQSLAVGCPSTAVVLPSKDAGYGVGYSVARTKITFSVTSWGEAINTSAELFAVNLRQTMTQLDDFLKLL